MFIFILFFYAWLQETVFHIVHPYDLHIALKYTCDYRRYQHKNGSLQQIQKQPKFYDTYENLNLQQNIISTGYTIVLVLSKMSHHVETQSDYYIRYIIDTISAK